MKSISYWKCSDRFLAYPTAESTYPNQDQILACAFKNVMADKNKNASTLLVKGQKSSTNSANDSYDVFIINLYVKLITFTLTLIQRMKTGSFDKSKWVLCIGQLCSTRDPRTACGPVKVLCGPVWIFAKVKVSYIYWQPFLILKILNLTFLMQLVFSAILSRLLPLQLGF